jgi:ribulose-phosphate 3-epimerase
MVLEAVKPVCRAGGVPIDVHLMIEKPERLIPAFVNAGADRLTVHVETCPHLNRTIQQIKGEGIQAGVTLNPATPLSSLEEILTEVDQVLIMSVNPGFGGQVFIPGSFGRVARIRKMLADRGLGEVEIEVDGGIGVHNAAQLAAAGADILVIGSAIFNAKASIADNIAQLQRAVSQEL